MSWVIKSWTTENQLRKFEWIEECIVKVSCFECLSYTATDYYIEPEDRPLLGLSGSLNYQDQYMTIVKILSHKIKNRTLVVFLEIKKD